MKHWKVATRLNFVAALAAACMAVLAAAAWLGLAQLAKLQDLSYQRSADSAEINRIAGLGDALYHVVADTYINRDFDKVAQRWARLTEDGEKMLAHAAEIADTQAERDAVASARKAFGEIRSIYGERFLPLVRQGGSVEEIQSLDARLDDIIDGFGANLAVVAKHLQEEAAGADREFDQKAGSTRIALVVAVLVGGVAIVLAALLVARSITSQLGMEPSEAMQLASRIAKGDLTPTSIDERSGKADLATALACMVANLQGLVTRVRTSADGVATASVQIAQGNGDLSSRTEQQASALQQTAATMEQLGSTVQQTASRAAQARGLAEGASAAAAQGGAVVRQVVQTMTDIAESSRRIADINAVVDGIAFQTNILALNAAVEAARAGEQGRGFAVVATEVRTLAQRSSEAAREIKSLIAESEARVEAGNSLVADAGQRMSAIEDAIQRVRAIVEDIAAASQEGSQGVAQVGQAVHQMDAATQQNAALVEQSAAAADSLRQQASSLVDLVATFRVQSESYAA